MIGDGLRRLLGVDEVRGLPLRAVRAVDERDARVVEQLLERQRILPILLDVVRVGLDALQSERGDPLDRPLDVVLPAPEGTRGPEKNVWIDGVERLVITRPIHLDGPETLTAAIMAASETADDMNSRLLVMVQVLSLASEKPIGSALCRPDNPSTHTRAPAAASAA